MELILSAIEVANAGQEADSRMVELEDIQLALIGGGVGEVVFG